jgi:hypothetical protein
MMGAFAITFIAVWIFALFATRYPALGLGFAIVAGPIILVIYCGSQLATLFRLSSILGEIIPK